MKTAYKRFAVCIDNKGYPASLEVGKLYRIVPDRASAAQGYIRIVDESGEDYGYSASRFLIRRLPAELQSVLARAQRKAAMASSPTNAKSSPRV